MPCMQGLIKPRNMISTKIKVFTNPRKVIPTKIKETTVYLFNKFNKYLQLQNCHHILKLQLFRADIYYILQPIILDVINSDMNSPVTLVPFSINISVTSFWCHDCHRTFIHHYLQVLTNGLLQIDKHVLLRKHENINQMYTSTLIGGHTM